MKDNKGSKVRRSADERKKLNRKIAEIIYISIGGIVMALGITSLILSAFINNMEGAFTAHPFYPLYQFETSFFETIGFGSDFRRFGTLLVLISMVYLLIVLYVYSLKADVEDKRAKQKKLREQNLKKFASNLDNLESKEKEVA